MRSGKWDDLDIRRVNILSICSLNKIKLLVMLSTTLFLVLSSACQNSQPQANFLLITLDTQRADHIGAYNPEFDISPNIDMLAQKGILFENCDSPIPITLPAHSVMFYSQMPHDLKIYNNGQALEQRSDRPSITKIFHEKGFATGAFISLGVLKDKFGLNEGFDVYDAYFPVGEYYISAEEINNKVFPWLEKIRDKKFFAWIHYSDPHSPYYPPDLPPEIKLYVNDTHIGDYHLNKRIHEIDCRLESGLNRIRFELQYDPSEIPVQSNPAFFDKLEFEDLSNETLLKYSLKSGLTRDDKDRIDINENVTFVEVLNPGEPCDGRIFLRGKMIRKKSVNRKYYRTEVEYMDRQIGKLLEKLRELQLFDKTHILVVGDHGEGLGEYINYSGGDDFGHVNFLYKVYTHVPMIIYNPLGKLEAERRAEPVSLLDVAPTIMGIMGFDQLPHFQGRDLLKTKLEVDHSIFLQTHTPQAEKDIFAFMRYPWYLIFVPDLRSFELFDLENDPSQENNIFNESDIPEAVINLQRELISKARSVLEAKKTVKIDDKSEEMLRALGYIK